LGLLVSAVVVSNTDNLTAILGLLEAMGHDVLEEDIARIPLLKTKHLKVLVSTVLNCILMWLTGI
jgi:Tn3 transposase DDE domain